jgi:hypothetical protein
MVHQHHLPSQEGTATPPLPLPDEESWPPPSALTTVYRGAIRSILSQPATPQSGTAATLLLTRRLYRGVVRVTGTGPGWLVGLIWWKANQASWSWSCIIICISVKSLQVKSKLVMLTSHYSLSHYYYIILPVLWHGWVRFLPTV